MRLTLRTLLAYLDDMVEPSQAKELGQKIKESPPAAAVIGRIRDVLRRRRLITPDVLGPKSGIDPNIVAEYLDNTLPPNGVEEVERICLESDVHLSEVAASHQILALVLGEPVDVRPTSRERMYVLRPSRPVAGTPGAAREAVQSVTVTRTPAGTPPAPAAPTESRPGTAAVAATVAAAAASKTNGVPASSGAAAGATKEAAAAPAPGSAPATRFAATIPDYLKPKPLWQRLLPMGVVAAVALVWGALIYHDPAFNIFRLGTSPQGSPTDPSKGTPGGDLVASNGPSPGGPRGTTGPTSGTPAASGTTGPGTGTVPPPSHPVGAAGKTPAGPGPATPGGTAVASATPRKTDGIDPQPPVDEPGTGTTKPPVATTVPPPPDATTPSTAPAPPTVASSTAPDAGPQPPTGTTPAPAAAAGPSLMYASSDGVLVWFDPQRKNWFVLPRRSVLHRDEQIAVPEPFEAAFDLGNKIGRVTAHGGTSCKYLGALPEAPVAFALRTGRLVFSRAADGAPEPILIALRVADETWKIELSAPGTECGVEIAPKPPTGFEKVPGPAAYAGSLFVSAGTVRFSDGQGADVVVDAGKCVSVTPQDRKDAVAVAKAAAAANPGQPVSPVELKTLPKWAEGTGSRTLTASVRRTRALFEKEFDLDPPISESLAPVVRKSDPLLSEAAVKCLALIQDHAALVEALARAAEHESRVQAIRGLQLWLGESVENAKPLRTDLATVYTGPDVDAVVQLLWGYDESDARNPVTSRKLVAWLDHGEIGIRELAFWHVKRLTGRDYDYLPHRPALQRQAAVMHWLSHVEKTGGLLPPTPAP